MAVTPGEYETIPYAGGHIDVGHTSHKRIQRINGDVTFTPVYDRAYLRIHAAGDDGFLATEMTPADAYALLVAVRRRCPHVEDLDMARPEDGASVTLTHIAPFGPAESLHLRLPDLERRYLVRGFRPSSDHRADVYELGAEITDGPLKPIGPDAKVEPVSAEPSERPESRSWPYPIASLPPIPPPGTETTTLKPGETVIIRVSPDARPSQVQEYRDRLEAAIGSAGLGMRVLIVAGDELAVQRTEETAE